MFPVCLVNNRERACRGIRRSDRRNDNNGFFVLYATPLATSIVSSADRHDYIRLQPSGLFPYSPITFLRYFTVKISVSTLLPPLPASSFSFWTFPHKKLVHNRQTRWPEFPRIAKNIIKLSRSLDISSRRAPTSCRTFYSSHMHPPVFSGLSFPRLSPVHLCRSACSISRSKCFAVRPNVFLQVFHRANLPKAILYTDAPLAGPLVRIPPSPRLQRFRVRRKYCGFQKSRPVFCPRRSSVPAERPEALL